MRVGSGEGAGANEARREAGESEGEVRYVCAGAGGASERDETRRARVRGASLLRGSPISWAYFWGGELGA